MVEKRDERVDMAYDVPEPYEDFLARTGLPASACTFCMRVGRDTRPAYTVKRRRAGLELGMLQSYCDEFHHFDTKRGVFYSSDPDTPLREVCPNCFTEVAANGSCLCS